MNSPHRALIVLSGLAVATMYMAIASSPRAQAQCPPGTTVCRSEGGVVYCGDCGVPDSSNIDSVHTYNLVMVPTAQITSGFTGRLYAPLAAHALAGATLDALIHGPEEASTRLAEIRMLREMNKTQLKWTLSTGNLGLDSAPKVTFKLTSGGRSVGSLSGSAVHAEFVEFPTRISVATTRTSTTVTWGFSGTVAVQMGSAPGKVGAVQRGDALAITFPVGSPGGVGRLDLNRLGTGAMDLASVKTTLIPASAETAK